MDRAVCSSLLKKSLSIAINFELFVSQVVSQLHTETHHQCWNVCTQNDTETCEEQSSSFPLEKPCCPLVSSGASGGGHPCWTCYHRSIRQLAVLCFPVTGTLHVYADVHAYSHALLVLLLLVGPSSSLGFTFGRRSGPPGLLCSNLRMNL